jgi:hypothetical protein
VLDQRKAAVGRLAPDHVARAEPGEVGAVTFVAGNDLHDFLLDVGDIKRSH